MRELIQLESVIKIRITVTRNNLKIHTMNNDKQWDELKNTEINYNSISGYIK